MFFRYRANNFVGAMVNGRIRNASNLVLVRQRREFSGLDHFSLHQAAFNCHLMSEQHGSRAIRSGRGNKDLQVNRLFELSQEVTRGLAQSRIAGGDLDQILD